jgi:sortase A
MSKPKRARKLRAIQRALSGVALLALGYCAWIVIGTEVRYAREDQRLEDLIFASTSPSDAPRQRARAELRRSGLVGRLEMPRLGLVAIVREGTSDDVLRFAAGHVPGTALPGEPGNVVIAGHRDTLFRPLKEVRPGDALRLTTPDGAFEYAVTQVEVVEPTRLDVLEPRAPREATLVTCYPFHFVGKAPLRFVVRAAPLAP